MEKKFKQAREAYEEFKLMFEGKPFAKVDKIVKQKKLSYGHFNPTSSISVRDINYKNICVTVSDKNGKIALEHTAEVWKKNGELCGTIWF